MQQKQARRAAEDYVRVSATVQELSIENQNTEIGRYADKNNFTIVRTTYSDPCRTSVTLGHRLGLTRLLSDVLSGAPRFEAILVHDVSRWGRCQDDYEAALYEFLCRISGACRALLRRAISQGRQRFVRAYEKSQEGNGQRIQVGSLEPLG